jgi:hypothetical protein
MDNLLFLYWVFSTLYVIGMDMYQKAGINLQGFLVAWVFGWALLPISLGTKRAKEVDKN